MQGESTENSARPESSGKLQGRYCVLEYRPEPWTSPPESAAPIFMLLLDGGKGLGLFLNPDWRSFVQAEDLEYVELFLSDVQQRTQQSPRQLFEQLSSLSLGPLVTLAAGTNLSEEPGFQELLEQFEAI